MTAYLLTPEVHAELLNLTYGYCSDDPMNKAWEMLKDMKPQAPAAWVVDGGKKNSMLLPTYAYELELEVPKIMCKPLYLGDTA